MIIIDDIEQLSPEWYALHAGVPGASSFSRIITTNGEPSKSQEDYIYELACEKITGEREQGFSSYAMEQGIIREDEARALFELLYDEPIRQVAFAFKDKNRGVGCSPDGLLGSKKNRASSGLELKCPLGKTHIKYLIKNKLPTDYFTQVQGSMWVCNTSTWYFMSYYPGVDPFIIEVARDYDFVAKLETEMERFLDKLNDIYEKLVKK